ncbi:glutathione S-transferase family protein [Agrobacterium vitis]|uniref:glutathione S-transferase family protein n=1 Tax=Agrobacterium vitis TaxID=373 RepID=UPI003D2D09DC
MTIADDKTPRLFGGDYSVYVRIARLCFVEKAVDYDLVPFDIFADGGPSPEYLKKHPFGRIPALEHDQFSLYETGAIARYIDEAFVGPKLQPENVADRARCNQAISIIDNYAYPHFVWGIYVERILKPSRGVASNEEKLTEALTKGQICLNALSRLIGDGPWFIGEQLTLADLYAAPVFDYFLMTSDGKEMIEPYANLKQWWARMSSRPSMTKTKPS